MGERKGLPIYQQISMQIYNDIASGALKVGDAIPTEAVLMRQYNASRTTVRNAIKSLSQEGIIGRRRGSGSFVKKNVTKAKVSLQGSFEDILDVIQNTSAKVFRFEYVDSTGDIRKNLSLTGPNRVLRVDRIRYAEETPFLYSINYLPDEIGQFLTKKNLEQYALLELIPKMCGIPIVKAVQNFGATMANTKMAELLGVPLGFPILEIKRVTMSSGDRPVNLFYGYFRSDMYKFTTVFSFKDRGSN